MASYVGSRLTGPGILLGVLAILAGPGTGQAEEDVWWQDRFNLRLGAFFPEVSTTARLDTSGGQLGPSISFEDTLGLDDSDTLAWADATVWIFPKWAIQLTYFDLSRDSTGNQTDIEIHWGDLVFPIGAQLDTQSDTEILRLQANWALIRDEKKRSVFPSVSTLPTFSPASSRT